MTLDVTIGKIILRQDEDNGRAYVWIKQCPGADFDVSPKKYTLSPREAYRSGSTSFWQFWRKNDLLGQLYEEMRTHPNSNDFDATYLEKYVERINQLEENSFESELDQDRLKWLKYWVNKAVELYGKEAGITFG